MNRRQFFGFTGAGLLSMVTFGAVPEAGATSTSKSRTKPEKPAKKRINDLHPAKKSPALKPPARPTVAVLYFDYAGKDKQLGVLKKGLAQMLISDLSTNERIQLVERTRLEAVMSELKIGGTHKMDKKTAAHIGKLLGAQYLVLGSYFSLMGSLRVDARIVAVETGRIVLSTGAYGKVDDFLTIQNKLATALGAQLDRALPRRPQRRGNKKGLSGGRSERGRRPVPMRRKRRHPRRLRTSTAIKYAMALDAKDRGDKVAAKAHLAAVIKEQPDFELARRDLAAFVQ